MTTYHFAGFWRRFVAYMIDGFIISVVFVVLGVVAGVAYFAGAMSGDSRVMIAKLTDPAQMASFTVWIWLFSLLINLGYFTYFHGSTGRTPGKMLLGLQVVSIEGAPISFGTAFLRSVGYLVSSLVFCLGYIWIGFDKKKQGWHDKIAKTVVIIREPQGNEAGISIPDASSRSQSPAGFGCVPGNFSQPDAKKPEAPSVEDAAGGGGQKIP
ncbi:MAG TPA: hypothetical protein DDY86_06755 [Syntrophaceae bacterium]|jgi:uncharacterized RDD family membrane protein YckC|nr:hypothetical protein [Syntrophaceae bacterium]